jgi:hypothetical protein
MRRKIVAEDPADFGDDTGRPGDGPALGILGQKRRLIGENRLDRLAKMRAKRIVETLIHLANEALHRLRI